MEECSSLVRWCVVVVTTICRIKINRVIEADFPWFGDLSLSESHINDDPCADDVAMSPKTIHRCSSSKRKIIVDQWCTLETHVGLALSNDASYTDI